MKIFVKNNDLKRPIRLYFPNSLLKAKFIYKMIVSKRKGELGTEDKEILEKLLVLRKVAYRALVNYIKTQGHFTLVEVNASDGTIVKISV